MIDDDFGESPFLTRIVTKAIGDRFFKDKTPLSLLIPQNLQLLLFHSLARSLSLG